MEEPIVSCDSVDLRYKQNSFRTSFNDQSNLILPLN